MNLTVSMQSLLNIWVKKNQKCKLFIFWMYLAEVDNTTIKLVSTMTCTIEKLVKEFKKLDMVCLKGETVMLQMELTELRCLLEVLENSSATTQNMLQTMTHMSTQASKKI